ncbi:MAG: DUF3137 domain-containing protein [Planctomycetota bacterium]
MSDGMFIVILIAGLLAAAGFGTWYSWKRAKERREALATLAGQLGMRFDAAKDYGHDERYTNFEIFRRGHSRAAFNTLTGPVSINGSPHPVVMGDFIYKVTSGSGKNRRTTTYRFSYTIVHLPLAGVPDLLIRPEHVFDKLGSMLGFDDIDFESAEFSRKFLVKSRDKRFAYDVVTPAMMEFLLETRGQAPAIDLEHGMVCLAQGGKRWTPEQFKQALAFADRFLSLWPEHVVADLRSRAG